MTHLGFDFLVLDMQHCELTQGDFPAVLGAFTSSGVTPVVRVPSNDYHIINWMMDQGVGAVMVPMVNSAGEARRAVEAAKFPPLGKRSFGPYRAARYSFKAAEYMSEADHLATLIIQIESEQAVDEIDEILAVPGIDAVFVGPNDVAFSRLGPGESIAMPGGADGGGGGSGADAAQQWTAFARGPEVLALCDRVLASAQQAGIPFGMTAGTMAEVGQWHGKGAAFMTLGCDFLFMRSGAETMRAGG